MLATPRQDSARLRAAATPGAALRADRGQRWLRVRSDLATKDYAVDDDSTGSPHDAWDGLAQNVVLRLSTSKGTPAVRAYLRQRLPQPGSRAAGPHRVRPQDAAEALGDLIAAGQVELLSVTADRTGGLATMHVTWRDTRTLAERTTSATATGQPR